MSWAKREIEKKLYPGLAGPGSCNVCWKWRQLSEERLCRICEAMSGAEKRYQHQMSYDRAEKQQRRIVRDIQSWSNPDGNPPQDAIPSNWALSLAQTIDQMGPLILIGVWLGIAVIIAM